MDEVRFILKFVKGPKCTFDGLHAIDIDGEYIYFEPPKDLKENHLILCVKCKKEFRCEELGTHLDLHMKLFMAT